MRKEAKRREKGETGNGPKLSVKKEVGDLLQCEVTFDVAGNEYIDSSNFASGKKRRQSCPHSKLDGAVRGADEVAENCDVGAIGANAAGVYRESKLFGLFEVDPSVVEFRQAESMRRQNAIQSRRIHRAGWTMTAPRTTSYLVELLPIAFLPSGHS